jgi:hypothetical protein
MNLRPTDDRTANMAEFQLRKAELLSLAGTNIPEVLKAAKLPANALEQAEQIAIQRDIYGLIEKILRARPILETNDATSKKEKIAAFFGREKATFQDRYSQAFGEDKGALIHRDVLRYLDLKKRLGPQVSPSLRDQISKVKYEELLEVSAIDYCRREMKAEDWKNCTSNLLKNEDSFKSRLKMAKEEPAIEAVPDPVPSALSSQATLQRTRRAKIAQ